MRGLSKADCMGERETFSHYWCLDDVELAVRSVRLKLLTGPFRLGHLMHLQTDKNDLSRGRYFNLNLAKLVVRTVLNGFKKRLEKEKTGTNNGFIFTLIILIY